MEATRIAMSQDETARSIRWEPCPEASLDDRGGVCADCGWPIDDHFSGIPIRWTARAA